MNYESIIIEKKYPLAWIKLNRPSVLNSLNSELLKALQAAVIELSNDKKVRIVIIIGTGKAFCAGADLTERLGMTESQVMDYHNLIQNTMLAIEQMSQPVIAALNGSAYGGGMELALACDLRVMVENAIMRLTEVRLGIIPGAGGTQRLSRLIGKSYSKKIILTACAISAQEALNIGLIHKIIPASATQDSLEDEQLMGIVNNWAQEIATAAPLALQAAKYAIDNGFDKDLLAGLAVETKSYLQILNTQDRLEGLSAFAEKRNPVYKGE